MLKKLPLGKNSCTSVPNFFSDFISIPIHNFLHNFWHKYKPIPVDFFPVILPFSPVKPFSNTLFNSFLFIPIPLSFIYNIINKFERR